MLVRKYYINVLLFVCLILASCSTTAYHKSPPRTVSSLSKPLIDRTDADQVKVQPPDYPTSYAEDAAISSAKSDFLSPIYKNLSPLDTQIISISFNQENFETILAFIAHQLALNLVISKDVYDVVPKEKAYLTLEFHNMPLRAVLNAILDTLNLSYHLKNGVLFIEAYEERLFDLGFLTTLRGSKFDLGGDVLGGLGDSTSTTSQGGSSDQEIVNPLKGNFEVTGKNKTQSSDIYQSLEANIKALLSDQGVYTLNPYAGTLFIRDLVPNVQRISNFIENLKKRYSKQVLIEAKIIEVELSKQHQLGINWDAILKNDLKDSLHLSSELSFFWNNNKSFVFQLTGSPYFDVIIKALETYGQVKIISNPRLRVVHAQPAMISVGKSIAYIREIDRQITSSENLSTVETNVQTSAVFDGLLFGVTPYIDDKNDITLHLVPIASNVLELREVQFGKDYAVTLPQINLRETSTVIRVHNNDLVVIGGLILDRQTSLKHSVPLLRNIPGVGHLFRQTSEERQKVELVILLKVNLVK